jgi:hypothetical protein
MKNLFYPILFILIVASSCSKVANHSQQNLQLVQDYINAVENLDHDAMENLLDDNYLGMGPSYGDSINKSQAVTNWKENVDKLYEKIEYVRSRNAAVIVPDGESKGEWVANWAELHITYQGDQGKVIIWANSIYQIENGKITKSYTFYNEADALRQLGYVFINPDDL